MRLLATIVSIGLILFTGALFAWSAEGTSVNAKALDLSVCEDFESGYTLGAELRDHPDWFYESGHSGPIPTAGIGVAGSVGLTNGSAAFSWLTHGFNWNDPTLTGVYIQMDFQTSGTGAFDDDRIGWSISDTDDSSDWIFGVQMDPGGGGAGGNIEAYWDGDSFGDNGGRSSIVDLPALTPDTWYRFHEEITKLTATSCRLDVTLTELDAAGNEVGVVVTGSILDTDLLANTAGEEIPNPGYFTPTTMWPVYKNHSGADGAVDNPCFGIYTAAPVEYTLTVDVVGNGTVNLDPAGGTYLADTSVELTALGDIGWVLDGWSGDLIGNANIETILMDGDKNVTATFVEFVPGNDICTDLESGYTLDSTIGTHPDWFDNGSGPVVTAGNGLNGSIGLAASGTIFTWTAHPFDWNASDFEGFNVQMDLQTDDGGFFDDDRIGWMISDDATSSSNIMGLQLDPKSGGGYNIEGYWDGVSATDKRPHIADLPTLGNNAWYRFRTEFTKLTDTSARIDVYLTELDGSGNPLSVVASGSILDTATLGDDEPHTKYFTGPIWPAFKNHTGGGAPADNPCFEVVTGAIPQFTLTVNTVGDGLVDLLPAGGIYDAGTLVDLTANPNPGSIFWAWSGDLSGDANPTSITMDGDKNVTATFIPESTLVPGDVIISSFQSTNPVGTQTNSEFIELFNATDQPIPLDYLQLTSRTDNNSDGVVDVDWALDEDMTGKVIPANGFFLIAESDVPAPGGLHDVETDMDLATGEGGIGERAIAFDLSIGGQHMDYVLYGWHDGSSPAGEIPPGDIAFDGVSYPRTEVLRNTVGGGSYAEGLIRRETPPDLYAGFDVEGFYTDETALGDGFPTGVWTCPHDNSFDAYEARNSLTPPVSLTMYNLTVTVIGDGTVTLDPAGGTYYENTSVELAATSEAGWIFAGWSVDLTGTTNPAVVTMTADLNITATFVEVVPLEAGHVIISAFQSWNTVGSQDPGEFIELFNTTSQPISLEGMELISRTDNDSDGVIDIDWALSADLTGKVIGPFGFFLVAESGVAAPGGLQDVVTDMDLATGEGGSAERAISIELAIDGVHMDYVLYGRHDGSDPAGELPPGDIPFDGSSWPRTEVIRNTLGTSSFQEGLAQRVLTELAGADYMEEGFYTDESVLGDGFPDGVWFCPHSTSFDDYEARNSLSPPLDSVVAAATGNIMARRDGTMVAVDFRVNFTDPTPLLVIRTVAGSNETRTWGVGDFSLIQDSGTGLFISLRDFDLVGFPREYTLVYRDGGGEMTLDQAKVELPPVLELKMSAFPNPFNPRVEIKFTIPRPAQTRLEIFDSRGHLVQSLVSEVKPAGEESVFWTGEDSRGRPVASGVYHLRLVVDQQRIIKTVTLLR